MPSCVRWVSLLCVCADVSGSHFHVRRWVLYHDCCCSSLVAFGPVPSGQIRCDTLWKYSAVLLVQLRCLVVKFAMFRYILVISTAWSVSFWFFHVMLELCFLDGSKALDHYFRDNKARENKKLHGMPPKKIGPFLKSGTKNIFCQVRWTEIRNGFSIFNEPLCTVFARSHSKPQQQTQVCSQSFCFSGFTRCHDAANCAWAQWPRMVPGQSPSVWPISARYSWISITLVCGMVNFHNFRLFRGNWSKFLAATPRIFLIWFLNSKGTFRCFSANFESIMAWFSWR